MKKHLSIRFVDSHPTIRNSKLLKMIADYIFRNIKIPEAISAKRIYGDIYKWDIHLLDNLNGTIKEGGINNFVYGFDDSATHTKDISNLGIDFSLFCERNIEISRILNLENKKIIATLKKCGFNNSRDQKFYYLIKDFCKLKP